MVTGRTPAEDTLEAIREKFELAINISHCYFHTEPNIQQCIRLALATSKALERRPPNAKVTW